jgi:flagellar hook assembly protein FlgD
LDADANVTVKVFNVMGQLVDVVTDGQMTVGTHAITWDASQVASGVYFINTEIGSTLNRQKVMLLK